MGVAAGATKPRASPLLQQQQQPLLQPAQKTPRTRQRLQQQR
jgi:hypothetical protein